MLTNHAARPMKLDLHIPGLLAAPARLVRQLQLHDAPALERWVARAKTYDAASGRHGYLCDRLAVQHAPLAALAWLGAQGNAPMRPVMLAEPVHLKAGMHDLVLFGGPALNATGDERARIARDVNEFFGSEPALEFAAGQLFVVLPAEFDVKTVSLHMALGRPVRDNLPRGTDARRLHAWMNELQMFLHDHALNRERATRGLPALNGLWPWGEGALPENVRTAGDVVFAESLPMRGLGCLLGEARAHRPLEEMLPSSGRHVIEWTACVDALDADDAAGWQAAVQRVSHNVLQPVLDWLAMNPAAEAVLYPGDGTARRLRGGDGFLQRAQRWFARDAKPLLCEEP